MKRFIFMLALIPLVFSTYSQCDLELSFVDWQSGEVEIIVHNSNGCGNGTDTLYVSHIDLGISNGIAILNEYEFANFPLHSFLDFQEQHFNQQYGNYAYSGDTLNFNLSEALNANIGSPTVLERWMEWYNDGTFCSEGEIFIWQINFSNAPEQLNPDWYNPFGTAQDYPDNAPWDNILPINGDCPCDTVYFYETDTIIDTIIEYISVTDTLILTEVDTLVEYIQLPPDTIVLIEVDTLIEYVQLPPDTVHEYIYLTDTMYIETIVYEYIYVYNTDTITEYNTETVYIDCETGELCGGNMLCDETSIFAPNAVTPNNDGWNDTWKVIADGACWSQWEVRIYNRWGELVWISTSSLDEWDADVASGVYVYTIIAHSSQNATVFEFNGTITVLY